MNAHTIAARTIAAYAETQAAYGLKPNVTRDGNVMLAAAKVATYHDVAIVPNDNRNEKVYRSYITVECYICGNTDSVGGWQFEHIHDDGNGLAGDELAKAIVDGTQDVAAIKFGCGSCNAAKNAERAFNKRLAKAGR